MVYECFKEFNSGLLDRNIIEKGTRFNLITNNKISKMYTLKEISNNIRPRILHLRYNGLTKYFKEVGQ